MQSRQQKGIILKGDGYDAKYTHDVVSAAPALARAL